MGKATGFIELRRSKLPKRPPEDRIKDYREIEQNLDERSLREQASRCMDCGIPFCHKGCPLGNYIPDWNDLVYLNRWKPAIDQLHRTNNFPEFTGRTCPAPCEEACVLNINDDAVTIKQIEKQIVDRAWDEGWIRPEPPLRSTGKRIAIVGSGPAGLAAAQQLARVGHAVTVFERDDRIGGLLRYGIPDFKLEKSNVDRRVAQMEAEGVTFRTSVNVGVDLAFEDLRQQYDAVLLAIGAQQPREMAVLGRNLPGVHLAMPYLAQQNRVVAGDPVENQITAAGKRVVILGGGDTGADCLGTAHRQGAVDVYHFHYKPTPPEARTAEMPWPWWPMTLRESSSHEEGGVRGFSVVTKAFSGNGKLEAMHGVRVEWEIDAVGRARMKEIPGTEFSMPVDLALIAIGFTGPELAPFEAPDLERSTRETIAVTESFRTNQDHVFACGDATRGASLVVWAIWEGREAAREIDLHLMGETTLPTVPNVHPL